VYRENGDYKSYDHSSILDAKVKAFIERQLSLGHYGPWEHPSNAHPYDHRDERRYSR